MNEKQYNPEDQVVLHGFRQFIKGLLAGFFEFLSFLEHVIIKKRWFIIVGLIIGLLAGFFLSKSRNDYYEASMLVSFTKLTKKSYAEMVTQLDFLARTSSSKNLSDELKVSEAVAGSILFLDSKNTSDEPLKGDTSTKVNQSFKIIVGVADRTATATLQPALINFFNSRPLLKRMGALEREISAERIVFIDRQLQKIDSLTTEFNRFLSTSKVSSTIYNNAIDPAAIFEQSAKLLYERDRAVRSLAMDNEAVLLIDGFKTARTSQRKSLAIYMSVLGGVGLLLGLLFGLLIETKKIVTSEPK